ncbi:hypothetical protein ASE54_27265, partial [Bacillus sp. Root131]
CLQTKNTSNEFAYLVCEFRRCFFHVPLFGFTSRMSGFFLYPAICRAVRPPPQNSSEAKKLGGGPAARKSLIGEG